MQSRKKKLIEVAIPLEAINAASAREKSIRHGHPSTLHLWWSRKPLATCRAVLFAQLVDDPSGYPEQFPTEGEVDKERQRLFGIIEKLIVWENSTNEPVLEQARTEIRRSCGGTLPFVYDPFSGGGSIPLEAQRLGLPAYGSDLNPIAVMIGKAMIEIPPKFKDSDPVHPGTRNRNHYRNADGLAEDVKHYGEWIRRQAWERIGRFYPTVDLPNSHGGGKATAIAWIWARTVPSPDPAFGNIHVPLIASFLLSSKAGQEVRIEPRVDRTSRSIRYQIREGGTKDEIDKAKLGTKAGRGANFICLLSNAAITPEYIKSKSMKGEMGQALVAVVAEGIRKRVYLAPASEMEQTAKQAIPQWEPDNALIGSCRDRLPSYGMNIFSDLFTNRQLLALTTFSDLVSEVRKKIEQDALAKGFSRDNPPLRDGGAGSKAYAEAVSVYLAFAVDKCADYWSSICSWNTPGQKIRNTFSRQALQMMWDFAETNPFSASTGNWTAMCNWICKFLEKAMPNSEGRAIQHDAQTVQYPRNTVVCTDPPYYDNICYADLSDFFYCWLKPLLKSVYPDLFSVLAAPKSEELIASPYRHQDKKAAGSFFLEGMSKTIANMANQDLHDSPTVIYYAFKQSEIAQEGISSTGWATFLTAVLKAGYAIVRTWPMRTEMPNRMAAMGKNALANSIVLVCRKKDDSAESISRAEFVSALKRELPSAIEELQKANISPADMPQSAIGPGIAIFSRSRSVLEANDSEMTVKTALQLINRELDEYFGLIQSDLDAETRFAITWFEQNGLASGDYGSANSLATARGISVDSVKRAGIVASVAGKVRILKRDELEPITPPPSPPDKPCLNSCLDMPATSYTSIGK